jgi:hypothetical protein
VQGGERDVLRFETAPEIAAAAHSTQPEAPATRDDAVQPTAARTTFPWPQAIVAGSGAVLIIAGGVVGLLALDAKSDFDSACPANQKVCDRSAQHKRDSADRLALASDVLWISGAAAVASGAIWWLVTRKNNESTALQARIAVAPHAAGVFVRSAL